MNIGSGGIHPQGAEGSPPTTPSLVPQGTPDHFGGPYHSVNRMSQFDPYTITKLSGLMSDVEQIAQSSNKLVAETMIDEIETIVRKLKHLATDMPKNWPEFSIELSRLRGYAFLGFRIASEHMRKAEPRSFVAKAQPKRTIDDLL